MLGARGLACCVVPLAGCLAAPPSADQLPPPEDDSGCSSLLRNSFDDADLWAAYDQEPGTSVNREPDAVRITAAPSGEQGSAYADLHSEASLPVLDTDLVASLSIHDVAGSVVGISWNNPGPGGEEDDDYFDLAVNDGVIQTIRHPAFGNFEVLCEPDCPAYDPEVHERLRLRARDGEVIYQVTAAGGGWDDISRAPLADPVHSSLAFAFARAPATGDVSVTHMEWAECER